jgi:hypothetical protein
MASRNAFTAGGAYGPSAATLQGPFKAGETIDIDVAVTAYHEGWVEMRLCEERKPASGADFGAATKVTQECLNKHVLKFDVAYTKSQHIGDMLHGRSDPSDYGPSKVAGWSVTRDETICTSDFDVRRRGRRGREGGWREGGGMMEGRGQHPHRDALCCNAGGTCSPAAALYCCAIRWQGTIMREGCVVMRGGRDTKV